MDEILQQHHVFIQSCVYLPSTRALIMPLNLNPLFFFLRLGTGAGSLGCSGGDASPSSSGSTNDLDLTLDVTCLNARPYVPSLHTD